MGSCGECGCEGKADGDADGIPFEVGEEGCGDAEGVAADDVDTEDEGYDDEEVGGETFEEFDGWGCCWLG